MVVDREGKEYFYGPMIYDSIWNDNFVKFPIMQLWIILDYIVLDYFSMDFNLITPSTSRMANVKPRLCIMYIPNFKPWKTDVVSNLGTELAV